MQYFFLHLFGNDVKSFAEGARGVMVNIIGNGHGDASSNPGGDCISHSTNTLGKGMNPIILPPAMGKLQARLDSSALVRQLV